MVAGACTTAAARAELGPYALQLVLRGGLLVECFPGVLVRATRARDPLTVAAAALHWCRGDGLLCRDTAAWLAGCARARTREVHLLRPPSRNRSAPPGIVVHHGTVPQAQRTVLCGLPAASLEHAVASLLCTTDAGIGFAVAEEAAAFHDPPERVAFRGRVRARIAERSDPRHRAQADRLARSVTGRTRSSAACTVLLTLVRHGWAVPRQWYPVRDARGREQYRLEFAWPAAKVALEVGADTCRNADSARDDDLAARGWSLVRVGDPADDWFDTLMAALAPAAGQRTNDQGVMPLQGRVRSCST